tara:strand:+ start:5048 stop:5281 length:234 start_codon:yes stop_codon:yes gene_type:complete
MKKSEWIYLSKAMWKYADKHEGKLSHLLKELVITVNTNIEMILNDNEQISEIIRKHRQGNTNETGIYDYGTSGNLQE